MKKCKQLLSTALAVTLGLTVAFNLAACEKNPQEQSNCEHVFGEWKFSQSSQNCNGGDFSRVCEECGHIDSRKGTEADHAWAYEYNNTHHWQVCGNCNEKTTPAIHEEDGAGCCRSCSLLLSTECVYYELSSDGTYAIVTGYDEMETDNIVISDTYENVPVTTIQASAFEYCSSLEQVVLPNSITTIGENAFNGCKRLMAVYLSKNVTTIEANAFKGCTDLTIFTAYDREQLPSGWSEDYNPDHAFVWGNHDGKRAANVSAKAAFVTDSMLREEDQSRTQVLINPDTGNVKIPSGFSRLTRFDGKTQPPGTPWTEGNLWHHNWDQTKLTAYGDVWFAAKLQNVHWVYTQNRNAEYTPPSWVYIHLKQTGETWDGFTLWSIETSIGGYICTTIEEQTGRYYDDNRPTNSIARLLWAEGFASNAILIYNFVPEEDRETHPVSIYCTEVVGVKLGA